MELVRELSLDHSADDEEDYRVQVRRYPRLSHEEQSRLLASRGRAREAANRKLIEHNLYLVFEAAGERKARGVSFGDLFQEGTVGLISAVEHYQDAEAGFEASLMAAIRASMDSVLAEAADARRNDESFVAACRLLETAERLLSTRLKRPATTPEIAKLLQWDEARVTAIHDLLESAHSLHDQQLLAYLDEDADRPPA